MIKNEDIKQLKSIFATKEDLEKFATKDELKKFATKDDLKRFATKDDLKKFATKDDHAELRKDVEALKADVKDIRGDIASLELRTNVRFDAVHQVLQELKAGQNKLYSLADATLKELVTMRQEQRIMAHTQERHSRWIHGLADHTGYVLQE